MYLRVGVCLLVVLTQGALSASDDYGSDATSTCPPLAIKAIRIDCSNADGEDQDCNKPETGSKVRITWKKNILKNNKGVINIVCKDNGEWKRASAPSSETQHTNSNGNGPKPQQKPKPKLLGVMPAPAGNPLASVPILNMLPIPPLPNISSIPNIGALGLPSIPGIPILG